MSLMVGQDEDVSNKQTTAWLQLKATHTHTRLDDVVISRGVVVLERGGTPFRQIFLSHNGAPVNIVDHSRNADTAAFRQINSYYKQLPYTRNLANWFSEKSLKLLPPDVIILSLKCTKFDFGWGSAPDPAAYSAPPDPIAGFKGAYF